MLVLARKKGEKISIRENIELEMKEINKVDAVVSLLLPLRINETIKINDNILIIMSAIDTISAYIGIEAPRHIKIVRDNAKNKFD